MSELDIEMMNGNGRKSQGHYYATAYYDILAWLETIPLSRPILDFDIDFTDGLLVAEIVAYYFPEYVDFDLLIQAKNMSQRAKNWRLLNTEVFPKISLHAPGTVVHDITNGDQRSIELFLLHLREKIEDHLIRTGRKSRLNWETWRSYNLERYRLPQLTIPLVKSKTFTKKRSNQLKRRPFLDFLPNLYQENLRAKEDEIDFIRTKLKRCETLLKVKDKKIQELENKLDRIQIKKTSN